MLTNNQIHQLESRFNKENSKLLKEAKREELRLKAKRKALIKRKKFQFQYTEEEKQNWRHFKSI